MTTLQDRDGNPIRTQDEAEAVKRGIPRLVLSILTGAWPINLCATGPFELWGTSGSASLAERHASNSLSARRPTINKQQQFEKDYPNIWKARNLLPGPEVFKDSYLFKVMFKSGMDWGLGPVDAALGLLLPHGYIILKEELDALFGPEEDDWYKAATELQGLGHFEAARVLKIIGWPRGSGATPPFEGLLGVPQEIAFDVKAAIGGGLQQLREILRKKTDAWVPAHGIENPRVRIDFRGAIARELIGRRKKQIERDFDAYLSGQNTLPSKPWEYKIDSTKITVELSGKPLSRADSGMMMVDDHADLIWQTIKSHISGKGTQALQRKIPFLLTYVNTPGSGGADMRSFSMATALRKHRADIPKLPGGKLLLGVLHLDFNRGPVRARAEGMFFRKAVWTAGLTSQDLQDKLQVVELWPEQLMARDY